MPHRHANIETTTSAPLPQATPLPAFAIPPSPSPRAQGGGHGGEGKPLYVPGSHADRQARVGRMSSPLRRGTHESWWTREMGFFNAVAKVGEQDPLGGWSHTRRPFRPSECWTRRATLFEERRCQTWVFFPVKEVHGLS